MIAVEPNRVRIIQVELLTAADSAEDDTDYNLVVLLKLSGFFCHLTSQVGSFFTRLDDLWEHTTIMNDWFFIVLLSRQRAVHLFHVLTDVADLHGWLADFDAPFIVDWSQLRGVGL